jgi:hypothetical protein
MGNLLINLAVLLFAPPMLAWCALRRALARGAGRPDQVA